MADGISTLISNDLRMRSKFNVNDDFPLDSGNEIQYIL